MKLWKKLLIGFGLAILGFVFLFYAGKELKRISDFGKRNEILQSPEPSVGQEQLKFAVMADIHQDTENLEKALEIAKKNQVDFVIIAGDLTSLGKKDELLAVKKILEASNIQYYAIPGNHDLWWSEKTGENAYGEVFGPDYQSFKERETKFILINNGSYRGMNTQQLNWLEEEIGECVRIDCLVFAHIPFNHPVSERVMGENNPQVASQAAQLVELMVKNQVKEVFVGHLHFSSEYEIEGLKTTVVGALTRSRNLQSVKFLKVWKTNSQIEKKEIFLSDFEPETRL